MELSPAARSAGVLLHVTSLPGPYGIGDLGPAAYAWVNTLERARQTWWQVLPLGPTGFGDSPYQSLSAFAGNPLLISLELLVEDGLLRRSNLSGTDLPPVSVAFEALIPYKANLLARAWMNFRSGSAPSLATYFEQFCTEQAEWLDDFALFMALKEAHGGISWQQWQSGLLLRQLTELKKARHDLRDQIMLHKFNQFLFHRQWCRLRDYAHCHHIWLIGDAPIFVAMDSADVWSQPDLFQLDHDLRPTVVAGVPPDYFSATGQLWGNPLYDWAAHRQTGYAWWIARLRATLELVDLIRLDHFRGFEAAWEIPANSPTAETGRWVKGPGAELFAVFSQALGGLPLIAEDLGVITVEVNALRNQFGLPGMRILQFAFGGAREDRFLPHNYERNTVVYTGTHDNDTTLGWYRSLTPAEMCFFRRYAPGADGDPAWGLIRLAWASVANRSIAPMQDVLSLGAQGRMNIPGQARGHWRWRLSEDMLTNDIVERLCELTEVYGRTAR